jgi:hypothetical protein
MDLFLSYAKNTSKRELTEQHYPDTFSYYWCPKKGSHGCKNIKVIQELVIQLGPGPVVLDKPAWKKKSTE